MKKFAAKMMTMTLTGVMALSALTAAPALAKETMVTGGAPLLIATQQETKSFGRVTVDGKDTKIDACVLVPLYTTAKALGFKVTKQKDKTYLLDNGVMHTELKIGTNEYVVTTSVEGMVGMSAPFSLSAAPTVINKRVYVPVEIFEALLGNEDRVALKDNGVSIVTEEKTAESEDDVQIPNPMHEHKTLAELVKAVGFDVKLPAVPAGYVQSALFDISGETADIRFTAGEKEICYRVSRESGDVSGDYNTYESKGTLTVNGVAVSWRGTKGVNVATWEKDGLSYSVQTDSALTEAQVITLVKSVL